METFNKELLVDYNIANFIREFISPEIFVGCFARDKVPITDLLLKNYWSCIVNLDLSSEPGSHFVALVFHDAQLFLFDSLPSKIHMLLMKPIIEEFQTQSTQRTTFWTNQMQYQSVKSNACGYFCIWFILKFDLLRPKITTIPYMMDVLKETNKSFINENRIIQDFSEIINAYVQRKKHKLLNCLFCK